jgi:hypothetical protein
MQKLFLKEKRSEHIDVVTSPISNKTLFAEAVSAHHIALQSWAEIVLEEECAIYK